MADRAGIETRWRSLWLRSLVTWAGLLGSCGIGLGAAGSHAGGGDLVRLASLFLLIHAAAMIAMAGVAIALPTASVAVLSAATLIGLGVSAFSGDLALLGFSGSHAMRGLAPLGGIGMILGWLVAAGSPWIPEPIGACFGFYLAPHLP